MESLESIKSEVWRSAFPPSSVYLCHFFVLMPELVLTEEHVGPLMRVLDYSSVVQCWVVKLICTRTGQCQSTWVYVIVVWLPGRNPVCSCGGHSSEYSSLLQSTVTISVDLKQDNNSTYNYYILTFLDSSRYDCSVKICFMNFTCNVQFRGKS